MSRNIVTAVDGSEHADYAFNWLLDNIAKEGDTIHIVHIYPSPKLPSLSFAEGFTLPVHEWEREIKAVSDFSGSASFFPSRLFHSSLLI